MSDKNYPTYRLRVSNELARALKQAGPDHVRATLSAAYAAGAAQPVERPAFQSKQVGEYKPMERIQVKPAKPEQPAPKKLDIAAMVAANEAKMQAKKSRITLSNGLNA